MNICFGFHQYYSLFGSRGVWLAAKSRALKRAYLIAVVPPGFSNPIYLRLRSSDVTLFRSILVDLEYEWPLGRLPTVIMDAGANVGFTSVFFARKYPHSKVIAIEPEQSNFEMLRKNTAPYPNVVAIRAALWRENRPLTIVDPGLGHWAFQVHESAEVTSRRNVSGLTIQGILERLGLDHIDILKVDIEGAEKEVFEDSTQWINRVSGVVIEIHEAIESGCREAVYSAVKNFGIERRLSDTTIFLRNSIALPPEAERLALNALQRRRALMNAFLPLEIIEVIDASKSKTSS